MKDAESPETDHKTGIENTDNIPPSVIRVSKSIRPSCPSTDGSRRLSVTDVVARTVRIPEGSCLRPSLDAVTVREQGYQYDVLKTELLTPEELPTDHVNDLLRLPDGFQGSLILESRPTNPDLWESLTRAESIVTERTQDGMAIEDTGEGHLRRHPPS